jgi:hypothetical protein
MKSARRTTFRLILDGAQTPKPFVESVVVWDVSPDPLAHLETVMKLYN